MKTRTLALAAAGATILGGLALAAPSALAQGCGSGQANCVSSTISVAQTETFSVTGTNGTPGTFTLGFTGTPGGPSNTQTVQYSVMTNDPKGWAVQVSGEDMSGRAGNSAVIPVSDINVLGQVPLFTNCSGIGCSVAVPEAGTVTTDSSSTYTTAAVGGSDTYGFIGPNNGSAPTGSSGANIPSVPADTYTGQVDYTLVPAS